MTNPAYEATNSDVEKLNPGKYAILYRDNWDGEGDTYHTLANLESDGRWLSDETGKELLEYEGDEILKAWPLNDGADALQSAPNGMMQLSNELAEMEQEFVELTVWYGAMPESNGKTNWTAILHRKGECLSTGITIDRSEYPDRVRYEADRMSHLIGELTEEPDILAYDEKKHSGYTARKEGE